MSASTSNSVDTRLQYPIDEAVAAALAHQDMSGFEQLYIAHRRRVYAICFSLVKNHEKAEDLTHEVFIQLGKKLTSFEHRATFTTWLHRFTVNLVVTQFRKERSQSKKNPGLWEETMGPDDLLKVMDHQTHHQEIESRSIDHITLENLLAKLPPGYRRCIIMRDYEGYEYEEIALITHKHLGTGKSQRHRAIESLRKMLTQEPSVRYNPILTEKD